MKLNAILLATTALLATAQATANFLIIHNRATFAKAKLVCDSMPQTKGLFLPVTPEDQENMYNIMKARHIRRAWLGFTVDHEVKSAITRDMNGTIVNTTYYGPDEPNNYRDHNERCGQIRVLPKNNYTHNWNDAPCDQRSAFFCLHPNAPQGTK